MGNYPPQEPIPAQTSSPPSYIVQDGHIYYQGPPVGATATQESQGKDDILPPAYPADTSRSENEHRQGYDNQYGYGNGSGYGYGHGNVAGPQTQVPPRVVVVDRQKRREAALVGMAVGCCLAGCTVM